MSYSTENEQRVRQWLREHAAKFWRERVTLKRGARLCREALDLRVTPNYLRLIIALERCSWQGRKRRSRPGMKAMRSREWQQLIQWLAKRASDEELRSCAIGMEKLTMRVQEEWSGRRRPGRPAVIEAARIVRKMRERSAAACV